MEVILWAFPLSWMATSLLMVLYYFGFYRPKHKLA